MKTRFKLYPQEQRWWSFGDYAAVLQLMKELQPRRVLEFGPGSSTLALIEGGAQCIDTCEDDDKWAAIYAERIEKQFYGLVRIHRYTWSEQISVGALDEQRYDVALIDGPRTTPRRPPVIAYAMDHCDVVVVPTEDEGRKDASFLRPIVQQMAADRGWSIDIRETGPLHGGFAVMRNPKC